MKALLAIWMIVAAPFIFAAETSAATIKGEVLEIKEVESYTYLRLKTKDGETWAAVVKAPVKKGAEVSIENTMVMTNFESKSLKKTFPTIVFGTLAGAAMSFPAASPPKQEAPDTPVPKAGGANARTVAEIITKATELKDKPVLVRGKVVKFTAGVMGKNWMHLRDGSGSAANNTNDIIVTTMDLAKIGDIVTAKGVVHTDKDFGSGYSYKVLVEEATLQQ